MHADFNFMNLNKIVKLSPLKVSGNIQYFVYLIKGFGSLADIMYHLLIHTHTKVRVSFYTCN